MVQLRQGKGKGSEALGERWCLPPLRGFQSAVYSCDRIAHPAKRARAHNSHPRCPETSYENGQSSRGWCDLGVRQERVMGV